MDDASEASVNDIGLPSSKSQPLYPSALSFPDTSLSEASSESEVSDTTAPRSQFSAAEYARQQGQHKAIIAKLEGAVASSERRLKSQAADIEKLREHNSQLERELRAARTMATVTPERCRVTQKTLQDEAKRAKKTAGISESEVARLQELVIVEAQQLSELQDFAEVERSTLMDKLAELEAGLQEQHGRAGGAEEQLAEARQQVQGLEEQQAAALKQVEELSVEREQLCSIVQAQAAQVEALQAQVAGLQLQREQALASSRRAGSDLDAALGSSHKMLKQVRGITFALDKHAGTLARLPDVALLLRSLKDWVAGSSKAWEDMAAGRQAQAGGDGAGAGASAAETGP